MSIHMSGIHCEHPCSLILCHLNVKEGEEMYIMCYVAEQSISTLIHVFYVQKYHEEIKMRLVFHRTPRCTLMFTQMFHTCSILSDSEFIIKMVNL